MNPDKFDETFRTLMTCKCEKILQIVETEHRDRTKPKEPSKVPWLAIKCPACSVELFRRDPEKTSVVITVLTKQEFELTMLPPAYANYRGHDLYVYHDDDMRADEYGMMFLWYGKMTTVEVEEYERPIFDNVLEAAHGLIDLLISLKEQGLVNEKGILQDPGNSAASSPEVKENLDRLYGKTEEKEDN